MPKIALVEWRDAMMVDGNQEVAELAELTEVGYLLSETEEAVMIGMEDPDGMIEGRWHLSIPRNCITSMKTVDVEKAFNSKSKKII
jgi:hypothetical protein